MQNNKLVRHPSSYDDAMNLLRADRCWDLMSPEERTMTIHGFLPGWIYEQHLGGKANPAQTDDCRWHELDQSRERDAFTAVMRDVCTRRGSSNE